MDSMKELIERIKSTTGIDIPDKPMSEEEYTKFKCESYNNNVGDLNETDGYNCERCKNKGYIAEARFVKGAWYEIHCECECQKARKAILCIMKSGLKEALRDYTFKKFETEEAWQETLKAKAIEYAKNPDRAWFFIGGQPGAGKSHLCTAIAAAFLKSGKNVRYMLWKDEATKLKGNVTDVKAYEEQIREYKEAEVLYIDDLFKTGRDQNNRPLPPTGADISVAFEILNYRYNNKSLLTIISTERTIQELIDIDEATGSRISQMSFSNGYGFNIKRDRAKNHRLKSIAEL